jgi:hypothetical protein
VSRAEKLCMKSRGVHRNHDADWNMKTSYCDTMLLGLALCGDTRRLHGQNDKREL